MVNNNFKPKKVIIDVAIRAINYAATHGFCKGRMLNNGNALYGMVITSVKRVYLGCFSLKIYILVGPEN
ncbi:hypothetical protein NC652_019060 [Populus alba x Populus x berolinensis]|nr:hypothetical protein NC652_019060 [Populus alba x Populus x berolinensis]